MYKIGEFSKLSLLTIKALRYYEQEGILIPTFIDKETNYRYYDTNQLEKAGLIKSLRQLGLSIEEIKKIVNGGSLVDVLQNKQEELQNNINQINQQISIIKYWLGGNEMDQQIVLKKLPACIVYYEERVLNDYSEITDLVLSSAEECLRLNPNLECSKPDYCFCEYLDDEYKERNIKVRYSQSVVRMGNENERIHFKKLDECQALCIYHKGSYSNFPKTYAKILNYIKENGYTMVDHIREVYIDGVWNKENEEDYLTELQVIIK